MSLSSAYYIAVHTGVDYNEDTYDAAAGRLVAMLTGLLADHETLTTLTGTEEFTAHTEMEVSLEDSVECRALVASAVVDLTAETKLKLDKAKLTKMIKARPQAEEWPAMKIAKKAAPDQCERQ